ncbi:MAG: hypothetical protein QF536_08365 [Arenicellales bacterium]|jgi:hypothetical protein|nr:hypothetical protein [Arenicellales bacterium]MDP6672530.1 hypothetical protein [Arenicellales bacterium]MDP6725190.1 hypothetical protein [Arenicellales bacterium]|tara:strand:+ start:12270 stop:12404 length:135 start_codon:yes stop_codon:yes gene_type:complete
MRSDEKRLVIGPGATVVLHYKRTLATGETVESTFAGEAETIVLW